MCDSLIGISGCAVRLLLDCSQQLVVAALHRQGRLLNQLITMPCRTYNFQDVLVANPSATCIVAHPSYAYDTYTGDSSYLQVSCSSYVGCCCHKHLQTPVGVA
jgi:hypothetical protein